MKILAKGIDVSTHQGVIDWDKVKAAGVQFAILRCGYGSDIADQDDAQFERNVAECERVGMPWGVYLYSYATSVDMAKSEAAHVLRLLGGRKPAYPVYLDLEDKAVAKCGKDLIREMAQVFVAAIEKAGYVAGIYANKNWNVTYLTDVWYDLKPRWIAQYNDECTYTGEYGMWQYTSKGAVDGIVGNVDMNYAYVDYPAMTGKQTAKPVAKKTVAEIAEEVIDGKWGNGTERKQKLAAAGYDPEAVQKKVNELSLGKPVAKPAVSTAPAAGKKLTLLLCPLYASATATKRVARKTGVYYLYDGMRLHGRYRITNSKANVGKPGQITGWIDAKYVK